MTEPLLRVSNLTKLYPITKGLFHRQVGQVRAVDNVSFHINEGETLGLVGESGCGKTTTGRLILRLVERTAGEMSFRLNGKTVNLGMLDGEELRSFRKNMQLIFQDPFSSLNPRMSVLDIIGEPLRAQGVPRQEIRDRVRQITEDVRLNYEFLQRYPHAFSGGQRQRIGIARALALQPKLVICDEPVSALDVSVQAQILNLLMEIQDKHGLAYLFVAHDLSVVERISHRVAVMYAGRIVETAPTEEMFQRPRHPYTVALMAAAPEPVPRKKRDRPLLQGDVADPSDLPPGCPFHPRCSHCEDTCRTLPLELHDVGEEHMTACHLADKIFGWA